MFESFYGLSANPFRLSPDERFIYNHKSYKKAKAYLKYALERAEGFVMVTGSPGMGKTLLVREILSNLNPAKILVTNLVSNQLQADDLLRMVALEFGFHAETDDKATLLNNIQQYISSHHAAGRRAILIIDDAQNLPVGSLEELRLLSNLQTADQSLIQIFLIGQDELRGIILGPGMEQVSQRLVATCRIEAMNVQQTQEYIEHRLKSAGWKHDPLIDPAVFPMIHQFSQGIPRQVNHLTGRLLLFGALEGKHALTEDDMWIILDELREEHWLPKLRREELELLKAAHKTTPITTSSANQAVVNLEQQFENLRERVRNIEQEEHQDPSPSPSEQRTPISEITEDLESKTESSKSDLTASDAQNLAAPVLNESEQIDDLVSSDSVDTSSNTDASLEEDTEPLDSPLRTDLDQREEIQASNNLSSEALNDSVTTVAEGLASDQTPMDSHVVASAPPDAPAEIQAKPQKGFEKRRFLKRLAFALSAILIGFTLFIPKPSDLPLLWEEISQQGRSLFFGADPTQQSSLTSRDNENLADEAPVSEEITLIVRDQVTPDKPVAQIQPSDVITDKAALTDDIKNPFTTEDTQAIIADQSALPIKPDSSLTPEVIDQAQRDLQLAEASVPSTDPMEFMPTPQVVTEQDSQYITSSSADTPSMTTEPKKNSSSESTPDEPQVTQQDEISLSQSESGEWLTPPQLDVEQDDQSIPSSLSAPPAPVNEQQVVQQANNDPSPIEDSSEEDDLELMTLQTLDPAIETETNLDQIYQVYFRFDSSRIDETYIPLMNDIVAKLNRYPPTYIQITGFTDASGDPVYNRLLSDRRATAIANYLKNQGIDEDRIQTHGQGPLPLEIESGTEIEQIKDREKKRRVDLRIRFDPKTSQPSNQMSAN